MRECFILNECYSKPKNEDVSLFLSVDGRSLLELLGRLHHGQSRRLRLPIKIQKMQLVIQPFFRFNAYFITHLGCICCLIIPHSLNYS